MNLSKPEPSPATPSLLAHALESVANAILITDAKGVFLWANPAFCRLSGYALQDLLGLTPAILHSGKQDASFYAHMWRTISAGQVWQSPVVNRRKDGSLYFVDEVITPLSDEHGVITHFIAIQHEIAETRLAQEQDRHLAYHDPLTDLPNRAYFSGALEQALAYARQHKKRVATFFLDLDKFKPVNDTLGHEVGDHLLIAVADRLRRAVRRHDTVARIGGDEFAILLGDIDDIKTASILAEKLIHAISQGYMIDKHPVQIGVSIGIAIFPEDGDNPKRLLGRADQAMYQAKRAGGNRFQFAANKNTGSTQA